MMAVDASQKVCPECGFPADGVVCAQCGVNLTYVRLLTQAEWREKAGLPVLESSLPDGNGQTSEGLCPHCGFPAGGASCERCGTNLTYVRLLTREEWEARAGLAAFDENTRAVIVVTTNDLPGHRVTQVYGEVFGLTARARNYFSNVGANVRAVTGGEVRGYTKLLAASRKEAVARLREAAAEHGANAVLAMRFDANEFNNVITEIAAYGTAVTVEADRG